MESTDALITALTTALAGLISGWGGFWLKGRQDRKTREENQKKEDAVTMRTAHIDFFNYYHHQRKIWSQGFLEQHKTDSWPNSSSSLEEVRFHRSLVISEILNEVDKLSLHTFDPVVQDHINRLRSYLYEKDARFTKHAREHTMYLWHHEYLAKIEGLETSNQDHFFDLLLDLDIFDNSFLKIIHALRASALNALIPSEKGKSSKGMFT